LRGHAVERDDIRVKPRRIEASRRVGAVRPVDGDGRDLGRADVRSRVWTAAMAGLLWHVIVD
jgi:hypothetical protein